MKHIYISTQPKQKNHTSTPKKLTNSQINPSLPPPAVGVLRQRHHLLQRRRQRRRERRIPADGARRVELEPRVHARDVEAVPTIRQHPQHLRFSVLRQAYRAHGVLRGSGAAAPLREDEFGVGVDDGLIEADGAGVLALVILVVLGDEDDPREVDAVLAGDAVAAAAAGGEGAAADVGGEEDGGEEDEEAEGDGDSVAEADGAEALGEGGLGGGG